MSDPIAALEGWYAGNCDGDWEHEYGVRIATIDNPGWSVTVDLSGTPMSGRTMRALDYETSDREWLRCRVEGGKFHGVGGPRSLGAILRAFHEWREGEAAHRQR